MIEYIQNYASKTYFTFCLILFFLSSLHKICNNNPIINYVCLANGSYKKELIIIFDINLFMKIYMIVEG